MRMKDSATLAEQTPLGKSPHPLADGITARLQQHLQRSKLGNGPATPVPAAGSPSHVPSWQEIHCGQAVREILSV
jgi:hypothetical protein